jgi:L-threonylcarbamoyladenylate synthase
VIELKNDENGIKEAVEILKNGGIGIFPTDTVYGIGCIPNKVNLDRFYDIKKREADKPTALLISSMGQLKSLTDFLSPKVERVTNKFWPGALTLVLPCSASVDTRISPVGFVGVRWPRYGLLEKIIGETGPLSVASANIADRQEPHRFVDIDESLKEIVDFVLVDDERESGIPSTVAKVSNEIFLILRSGEITLEDIEAI